MRVIVGEKALAELRDATARYRRISKLLARRFGEEIQHAKTLISEAPLRWAEVEPGVRRVVLRNFPFSLLYAIDPDQVVVLVVKHHKRHPDYWHDR